MGIYKEDKICISQEPVIQCSQDSYPQEMRKKTGSFVCLPGGRTAKLYIERIEHGEYPQELKQQPVAFRTEMDQPVSCRPRQIYFLGDLSFFSTNFLGKNFV